MDRLTLNKCITKRPQKEVTFALGLKRTRSFLSEEVVGAVPSEKKVYEQCVRAMKKLCSVRRKGFHMTEMAGRTGRSLLQCSTFP